MPHWHDWQRLSKGKTISELVDTNLDMFHLIVSSRDHLQNHMASVNGLTVSTGYCYIGINHGHLSLLSELAMSSRRVSCIILIWQPEHRALIRNVELTKVSCCRMSSQSCSECMCVWVGYVCLCVLGTEQTGRGVREYTESTGLLTALVNHARVRASDGQVGGAKVDTAVVKATQTACRYSNIETSYCFKDCLNMENCTKRKK